MLDDWLEEGLAEYARDQEKDTNFGYDAVETTKRRKAPTRTVKAEDEQLKPRDRKILTSTMRDARRNFITPRWAIGKHLDFVADMSFQPCTGDEAFDKSLSDFVSMASKKENFDISGRHSLDRFMRMAEAARIIDGDFMAIRTRGGFLQAIEADRIQNPDERSVGGLVMSDQEMLDEWVHGVKTNKYGKPLQYAIHQRTKSGFYWEGNISARKVITHGFYDRFDQVRGISPMAPAINYLKDLHESYDYALAKSKIAQLFALAVTRDADDGLNQDYEDDEPSDTTINFGKDPQVLDLNSGEDAKFLSVNTPESDTQAFWENMTSLVLKSLNIPYCFWQENHTNFFGSRASLILYLRSVEKWREDVKDFRNDWLCWRLKVGQLRGEINLPASFECDPKNWKWIPTGIAYWNPQQEIAADVEAVENKLRTRTEIRRERFGDDWQTSVADVLKQENEYLDKLGLLPEVVEPNPNQESEDSSDE